MGATRMFQRDSRRGAAARSRTLFSSLGSALLLGLASLAATPGGAAPVLELVTSDVVEPTHLSHAGDSRLFIVEQRGTVQIFVEGQGILPAPFLDIQSLVVSGGELGLFSIAFHPDYASNGFFFVSYSQIGGATVIERYERSATDPDRAEPTSGKLLLAVPQPFPNHNGGQLAFGADGYLYLGLGDGGLFNDPFCHGQRSDTLLGSLLRIDVDQNVGSAPYYGIPADNPFTGAKDPSDLVPDEIWATGQRNPWRFSFDRLTGDLLIGDVGQGSREEISFQPASSTGGENYGWPIMEGFECFDPDPIQASCPVGTPSCFSPAFTEPVHDYEHTNGNCSVTGGYVYRGSAVPGLVGRYLFGDYCTGNYWSMEPGSWQPVLHGSGGFGLRSFGEDAQGELYALYASVFRVVDGPPVCGDGLLEAAEQCDDGAANGAFPSCCSASCSCAVGTPCAGGPQCQDFVTCSLQGEACQCATLP